MEKIPTAVSILSKHSVNYGTIEGNPRAIVKGSEAINAMIEFAQLHVQAALQAAAENAETRELPHTWCIECLNSYPLENIK